MSGERLDVLEGFEIAEELKQALVESSLKLFQKQTAEQAREHPHGKKEAGAAGDPALAIGGKPAAGNYTMHMGMMP